MPSTPSQTTVPDAVGLVGTDQFAVLSISLVTLMQQLRKYTRSRFQVTLYLTSPNTTNIWDSYSMMIFQVPQHLGNYKLVHLTTTSGDSHQGKLATASSDLNHWSSFAMGICMFFYFYLFFYFFLLWIVILVVTSFCAYIFMSFFLLLVLDL